jgi:hypothetical protein
MDPDEKKELLASLEGGRQAFAGAVAGVTEETAARIPGPDRWSILQCVEHVAVTEEYLFGRLVAATEGEPMLNSKREAAIKARAADRTRRIAAPAPVEPAGRFATVADALMHFSNTRARTIQFVENSVADLRSQITSHPLIGTVNCYETLLMIAAHPKRHAEQIQQAKEELGVISSR